jgi:hypothetical protein
MENASRKQTRVPSKTLDRCPEEKGSHDEGSARSSQAVGMTHEPLDVNSSTDLEEYFDSRCESIQQLNWKMVLKAWIKEIEPGKQTTYPYNKKPPDEKPPPWWPPGIPHKEPDHSTKPGEMSLDRMRLAANHL